MPLCSNALKHVCNPSEGIPADVTSGDDVASSKYKSTCGGDSGSYCCSVSALWVLHLIYCCLSCLKFIMATGKHESWCVSGSSFLPALASLRVGIHTVCALLVWERSTLEGAQLIASCLSTEVFETILQSRAPFMRKSYAIVSHTGAFILPGCYVISTGDISRDSLGWITHVSERGNTGSLPKHSDAASRSLWEPWLHM